MRVAWRAAAWDDLRCIFSYLAKRNQAATARLVEALILSADSLASFPWRGWPGRVPDTRESVAARPCHPVHRVEHDAGVVRLPRVWQGAQTSLEASR